ncbi:MAG TPA: carboxypeptidase-like regulatory domain-containing protein [Bryobacteraceae bacterium]|nr:carboxypeptidase-like regulatory domain-containing protein [Bryobacteraceae bacterium]
MHSRLLKMRAVLLSAALMTVCVGLFGQATSSSSIVGQVTDSTAAAIPAAKVTLTDLSTKQARETQTNDQGRYIFVNVDPGKYSVVASKEGFAKSEVASQEVDVSTTLTLNFKMEIGTATTTVEVQAVSGAELQTTNAMVGNTIDQNSIMHLPNLGRDVQTLAVLQPGVTSSGYTAGSYMDQNTYMLDGGNTSDDMAGNTIGYQTNFTGLGGGQTSNFATGVVPTPVESVEEVRVSVFGQGADFNNSTGANVQMVTKRGTNQYHGAGYGFYYATNVGAANSWANNHTPSNLPGFGPLSYTPLISNHRSRFGVAIGGPIVPKDFLGKKWYFFFNYEGSRFPNVGTTEYTVPSPLMRAGVIQVPNSSGTYVAYNLNPNPVTVNGVTYSPATCGTGLCDPRGIGLNPIANQIWSKFMPLPNDPTAGDQYNTQGWITSIRAPLTQNNYVGRIDHEFHDKWRLMTSYRFSKIINLTTNQYDIGGALPGDTFGNAVAKAPRPQLDSYFITGLTTNITPSLTNDFRFAYLRQFWQWTDSGGPPQIPGLGGAVEFGGESTAALVPYNVNSQSIRQRFWDGHDMQFIDNLTQIKGNHLFQYGGSYQHNYDYHERSDNGVGVNNQITYWLSNSGILNWSNSPYIPSTVPSSQYSNWETLYTEALGIVSNTQVAYIRQGGTLALEPLGSYAANQATIPYYNFYFSDTWHLKPSLTITYGLAYALEMPPYERLGRQTELVDAAGNIVTSEAFLAQRQKAALAGQIYNPTIGFETVRNVGNGLKYPYKPFYGEFSPRASLAWNPSHADGLLGKIVGQRKSVLRVGYGRIYGRINGVNQVLSPLLAPGAIQAVQCQGVTTSGQCLGAGVVTAANAFRIGTDGLTAPLPSALPVLPQPYFTGGTNGAAADPTILDYNYRPNQTDNITVSVQRQISSKLMLDTGYMFRHSQHETSELNVDAVPYMLTLGNQQFAQAFANLYQALCGGTAYPCPGGVAPANVPVQPFFEAALGGASSSYCAGYTSCTAALAANQTSNIKNLLVTNLWTAMNNASSWQLGRTMISQPLNGGFGQATSLMISGSQGYSNYNGLYVTFRASDWHGLTTTSNFTWSKAIGTGQIAQYNSSYTLVSPYNLSASSGINAYDYKFIYNQALFYQPPYFKGQKGVLGHILGGWNVAPLLTAQSGAGMSVGYAPSSILQAWGESNSSGSGALTENAVALAPFTGGHAAHSGVAGSGGIGTNNPYGMNMFTNPQSVYAEFRPCVLGYDTSCGGYYNLRGLPRWNLDATVTKDIGIFRERIGAELHFQITNIMNHTVFSTPASLSLTSPTTFGRFTGQANTPRQMEFGLRIHF